ncbi:penicillin-binding protein 2 [Variovorax sp. RA8]|uniref:penicillin-binding protein 2 n=1 Tax=Variovorax sp. (strain JCM 16519 / RA8) TaxID=662548 RepID=UPI0013195232|nr:penicillin-binding protein 2 [Variovorax sp. RA8]VTU14138.1 Sporulation-specific penicillin-binding protein [Variovorax sp. RA8]
MTELRNVAADLARFRRRVLVIGLVVLVAFGLLCARLFFLQVVRHEDLAEQAESNRTAVVPVVPNRGLILDRNGIVLASNYSAYTLEITPSKVGSLEDTIDSLGEVVEVSHRDRRRFKRLREDSRSFDSIPIRTRLTDEEVARFAAQRYRFPGVEIKARLFRNYPNGELAAHVLGYIGRINQREKAAMEEWSEEDQANYKGTDYIGKLGIEQSYEKTLHGQTGVEQMETSAGGRAVRRLGSHPATPGNTVKLSLDIKLQKLIEDMFGERRGALVAIDPNTGEILAFVSKPTFDPNLFVEGIDTESWQALNESIDKPLLNRALRGTYPPGSTYKPFMALAALQLNKRAPSLVVNDPGFYTFGGHTFRSHEGGLGGVDMHRAIQMSSNTYFYSLAVDMGVDTIHDFMKPLGFGQITGIDLQGEVRGLLPSTTWKREAYKRPEMKKWYPGETVSLGIGQGYNSFTMLQLAVAEATLANGGIRHRPHVVKAIKDTVTGEVNELPQPPGENLGYQPKHVDLVRNALVAVNKGGTGTRVFAGAPYSSAGKTGTAQAVAWGQNTKYNAKALEEHQRDHSLFAAFAPAEAPKIAVAIIVENAGFGAAAAAPIVRRVFDYWLADQYPNEQDLAAVQAGKAAAPLGKPRVASELSWPIVSGAATAP